MAQQHKVTKKNVFWIASILIVLLLAIHILAFTKITFYNPSDLGLLIKLPITFWIGLSFLTVLLYLGRKSGVRTVAVAILIFFYLFCIPVLISENKAEFLALSYAFSSQGSYLLSVGHVDFSALGYMSHQNWPGFFFDAGALSRITSLPTTLFADYFPLLTLSLIGIMVYSTLKLRLNKVSSSFGALWFIASFWTIQHYYSPQGLAYIFFFAIFFFLTKLFFEKKQNAALPLIVLILFTALVGTHLLTSLAIALGFIAAYALAKFFPQKRKLVSFYSITTCILLVSIFIAYQMLVVSGSFDGIVKLLIAQLSQGETHLAVISQGRQFTSPALQLLLFGSYGITIINVIIALIAILATTIGLFISKKEEARSDLFFIAWIIIAGLIGVSVYYGSEVIQRAFIIGLLPISYFVAKFFSKKSRIMVFLLIIVVFLQIPAHYAHMSWMYVPTSEMRGGSFYARYAPSGASFFYEPVLGSFDEGPLNGTIVSITISAPGRLIPSSEVVDEIVGRADFVIISSQMKNYFQFFYGNLLENVSLDQYSRLYDNGFFQVYSR